MPRTFPLSQLTQTGGQSPKPPVLDRRGRAGECVASPDTLDLQCGVPRLVAESAQGPLLGVPRFSAPSPGRPAEGSPPEPDPPLPNAEKRGHPLPPFEPRPARSPGTLSPRYGICERGKHPAGTGVASMQPKGFQVPGLYIFEKLEVVWGNRPRPVVGLKESSGERRLWI